MLLCIQVDFYQKKRGLISMIVIATLPPTTKWEKHTLCGLPLTRGAYSRFKLALCLQKCHYPLYAMGRVSSSCSWKEYAVVPVNSVSDPILTPYFSPTELLVLFERRTSAHWLRKTRTNGQHYLVQGGTLHNHFRLQQRNLGFHKSYLNHPMS